MFYFGYLVFEVPSNLILRRTGARVWIARIMVTWGLVSGATMLVTGFWSFSARPHPAGRCRGGVLSRHHLLFDLLVSDAGTHPGGGQLHGGERRGRNHHQLALGSDHAEFRPGGWTARLAVGLSAREHPFGDPGRVRPFLSDRSSRPGTLARRRRTTSGWQSG